MKKSALKWIEIVPYGLVGGMIPEVSAMLFRRKKGVGRFSIWLTELQSRVALDQSLNKEQTFSFVQKIFKQEKITPEKCFFVKTEGDRDVVMVSFNKNRKALEFYADEVLSFCMLNNCQFFCTKEFLETSRNEIPRRLKRKVLEKKPAYLN